MGVKTILFDAVKARIETVTDIKIVALYNSQFDNELKERPKTYPVAYIEFSNIEWGKLNAKAASGTGYEKYSHTQNGMITLTIHIGFVKYEHETDSFPIIMPIVEKVHNVLSAYEGEQFTNLQRVSEIQDINHDNVIDWQINYETEVLEAGVDETTEAGGATIVEKAGGTTDVILNTDLDIDSDIIRTGEW